MFTLQLLLHFFNWAEELEFQSRYESYLWISEFDSGY